MTGEPTLTGHPHFSPGIAARRNRVREPILPEANRPDFDDLPDYLREGLTVHFVADSRRWPRSPSATPPRRTLQESEPRGRGMASPTGALSPNHQRPRLNSTPGKGRTPAHPRQAEPRAFFSRRGPRRGWVVGGCAGGTGKPASVRTCERPFAGISVPSVAIAPKESCSPQRSQGAQRVPASLNPAVIPRVSDPRSEPGSGATPNPPVPRSPVRPSRSRERTSTDPRLSRRNATG